MFQRGVVDGFRPLVVAGPGNAETVDPQVLAHLHDHANDVVQMGQDHGHQQQVQQGQFRGHGDGLPQAENGANHHHERHQKVVE